MEGGGDGRFWWRWGSGGGGGFGGGDVHFDVEFLVGGMFGVFGFQGLSGFEF